MRVLFGLLFLIGGAVSFIYPWAVQSFSGKEIGTWQVFDPVGGFHAINAVLDPSDAPVRILIDLTSMAAPTAQGSRTVLTFAAATRGNTVMTETLTFINAIAKDDAPLTVEQTYREEVGVLPEILEGPYTFTIGPGNAEDIKIKAVQLILRGGAGGVDERARPVGLGLMALGFAGLIASFRRRGSGSTNSQPPGPRWGRGPR